MKTKKWPIDKKRLLWIIWKDAYGDKSSIRDEDLGTLQLTTNTSLGWIIHENAERVVLAYEMSGTGEREFTVIPTGWIVERIPLFPQRKKAESDTPNKPDDAGGRPGA